MIGRERDLAAIEAFLGAAGPRILLLEGEPGIGKTTLWDAACRSAAERGLTVMTCRPTQPEITLAFGGLVDLFETVPDSVLARLPEAQHRALAVALRRSPPDAGYPDPLAVSAGVRAALALLAADGPFVLAIDDAQWLDASTAGVLGYVIRRLADEPIALLVARRPDGGAAGAGSGGPQGLDLSAPRVALERLVLSPLSLSSLHHVIRERTGQVLPRPLLHRIVDAAAGNPFMALGLTAAIFDGPAIPGPGEPLPAPANMLDVVARRVRRLPVQARAALLVIACLPAPTEATLAAVLGDDLGGALDAAQAAEIIDVRDGAIRFAHPLYAQCVLRLASAAKRREIHRRLSEITDEPEERARHLARSVDPPSDAVALALDAGARAARSRGALRAAAELLDEARRFTGPEDTATGHRRAFEAAELSILAGDRASAGLLLKRLVVEAASPLRERAVGLFAEILLNRGEIDEAEALLRAATSASAIPSVTARLDLDLTYLSFLRPDTAEAERCAIRAVAAARQADEPGLLAEAVAYAALARHLAGSDVDEPDLAEALALEDTGRPPYLGMPPSGNIALVHEFRGRHDAARTLLERARASLDAIGDDCDLAHVLFWLSWVELRAGRLDVARDVAIHAATVAESTGSALLRAWAVAQQALIEASRGHSAQAEALANEAEQGHGAEGLVPVWIAAARGLARLAAGNAAGAATAYARVLEAGTTSTLSEPVFGYFLPDAAEALARAGHPATATAVLEPFEAIARSSGRTWAIVAGLRARSAILAQAGSLDEAVTRLREAIERHDPVELPLERARALLQLGQLERRLGERRAARESFEAAADAFGAMGASAWEAHAREELQRVPGRRAEASTLTPTEREVAELSGSGLTNREVAAALFVSPKTVESNLARIYRKLGIATRAELGAWFTRERGSPPRANS